MTLWVFLVILIFLAYNCWVSITDLRIVFYKFAKDKPYCQYKDNLKTKFVMLLQGQIPLLILIPSNIAIVTTVIIQTRKAKDLQPDQQKEMNKSIGITIMILSITVSFIILQLPFSIFLTCCDKGPNVRIIRNVMSIFPVINSSINFYLYFLSSNTFRNQVKIEMSRICVRCFPSLKGKLERQPSVATVSSKISNNE